MVKFNTFQNNAAQQNLRAPMNSYPSPVPFPPRPPPPLPSLHNYVQEWKASFAIQLDGASGDARLP